MVVYIFVAEIQTYFYSIIIGIKTNERTINMYMDQQNKRFGAWRVSDTDPNSEVTFSIFIPDRLKDPTQYAEQPVDPKRDNSGNVIYIPDYGDPKIESIYVVGNFQQRIGQSNNWEINQNNIMNRVDHPKGYVWEYTTSKKLPAGFYEYKYAVKFFDQPIPRYVGDPCTRYGGKDVLNRNSGFVVGPSPIANTLSLTSIESYRDLIIYELSIDDFTAGYRDGMCPLDAIHLYKDKNGKSRLDYLQALGINAILFLPWTAWSNDDYSWGYTPYAYFSVEHRYTEDPTPGCETTQLSRLRDLINDCHARGIHVIMDGVFNHVCPDYDPNYGGFSYRYLYKNPDASPYVGNFGGTFGGLIDLDYNNGCTQEFIRDVCYYWIDEFKIDGIRFDNTTNYYIPGNKSGIPTLLSDIRNKVTDPNFSLTLEHIDISAANVVDNTDATSYWSNSLYNDCFDGLWNNTIRPQALTDLDAHFWLHSTNKIATTYLSNHDHSHVTWQCGANDNSGSMKWYKVQPYAIALFTSPGTPMIQNGQEIGEDHWIPEDDKGSNRRVKSRPLRWEYESDYIGTTLNDRYTKLIQIRLKYDALRSDNFYPSQWQNWQTQFDLQGYGLDTSRKLMIFHRWGNDTAGVLHHFMIAINFSDTHQHVDIPVPMNGVWKDILDDTSHSLLTDAYWIRNYQVNSNWGVIFHLQ